MTVHQGCPVRVTPLRMDLSRWTPSRSQSRILRKAHDVAVTVERPTVDDEHQHLFALHTRRFRTNVPERLETFLGPDPGRRQHPQGYPCDCVEICVRKGGRLVAASYLDLGREAASSVYGFFDPSEHRRSLGIATLLWEIQHARERGCRYLYPGYAYDEPSAYDYKKRLGALERFNWRTWEAWDPG